VVGESGSGKTTLALALLRLISSEGRIRFSGTDLQALHPRDLRPLRRHMQIIFQDPYGSLSPRLSVREIIQEGMPIHMPELSAQQREEAVAEVLREVGLTPEMMGRFPHEFSGGQRQRIAIARAIVADPSVLILDDATSAVDPSKEYEIREAMGGVMRGRTTIVIAHRAGTIAMADRVVLVDEGRVVADGTHDELLANSPRYRAVLAATERADSDDRQNHDRVTTNEEAR
jgi:ABC-type microcin C transport system duplicated ATPase subunit YejF